MLGKLSSFWGREEIDWIQVDFSRWSENSVEKNNFNLVKNAILNKRLLLMDYYSGNGTHMKRTVEPMKLVFKGQDWYLFSFCIVREDFRIFKITRMKNLEALDESFNVLTTNNGGNIIYLCFIYPYELSPRCAK